MKPLKINILIQDYDQLFYIFEAYIPFCSFTSGQRVMVRTCNGLELRDTGPYSDSEDLVDDPTGVFPSASSRDELTPR